MHSAVVCLEIHMWSFLIYVKLYNWNQYASQNITYASTSTSTIYPLSIVMSQKFTEGKHLLELFTIAQSRLLWRICQLYVSVYSTVNTH